MPKRPTDHYNFFPSYKVDLHHGISIYIHVKKYIVSFRKCLELCGFIQF